MRGQGWGGGEREEAPEDVREERPCPSPRVGKPREELEALNPHHTPLKAGSYSKVIGRGTERQHFYLVFLQCDYSGSLERLFFFCLLDFFIKKNIGNILSFLPTLRSLGGLRCEQLGFFPPLIESLESFDP